MVTEGRILVITKQKTNIQLSRMSLCVEVDCASRATGLLQLSVFVH